MNTAPQYSASLQMSASLSATPLRAVALPHGIEFGRIQSKGMLVFGTHQVPCTVLLPMWNVPNPDFYSPPLMCPAISQTPSTVDLKHN